MLLFKVEAIGSDVTRALLPRRQNDVTIIDHAYDRLGCITCHYDNDNATGGHHDDVIRPVVLQQQVKCQSYRTLERMTSSDHMSPTCPPKDTTPSGNGMQQSNCF